MPQNDFIGVGLFFCFILATGLPVILLKAFFNLPFEITRKLYHLVVTFSIFPLVRFFSSWYMAVLALLLLAALAYPALALGEQSALYRRFAVERKSGEFRSSLIIVVGMLALLIFIFWGLLGEQWKYIAVVAVLAWGLGDAAAALVGKAFGRRPIQHPRIAGRKTYEGTLAMFVTAGLAMFVTLLTEAGLVWQVSLAVALLVAPLCAVVELFSNRGLDTLTVPVSTGLAVLSLMVLFSALGV